MEKQEIIKKFLNLIGKCGTYEDFLMRNLKIDLEKNVIENTFKKRTYKLKNEEILLLKNAVEKVSKNEIDIFIAIEDQKKMIKAEKKMLIEERKNKEIYNEFLGYMGVQEISLSRGRGRPKKILI